MWSSTPSPAVKQCCYLYWIVSLKKKPEVIREIRNQVPLVFRKRPDGGTEIAPGKEVLNLFFPAHSASVLPQLVFVL